MPALPDTFMGGFAPWLQNIRLDSNSTGDPYVGLCRQIPSTGYISSDSIILLYIGDYLPWSITPASHHTDCLSRSSHLYFGDHLEYLEDIVVQIDAPQLDCFGKKYTGKMKTLISILKFPIYARSSIDQKSYPGPGSRS